MQPETSHTIRCDWLYRGSGRLVVSTTMTHMHQLRGLHPHAQSSQWQTASTSSSTKSTSRACTSTGSSMIMKYCICSIHQVTRPPPLAHESSALSKCSMASNSPAADGIRSSPAYSHPWASRGAQSTRPSSSRSMLRPRTILG